MIKTTLPAFVTTFDDKSKSLVTTDKEIVVEIDTSLFAEQRWEANFPHNAKSETLFAYIERMRDEGKIDAAHVLSHLKALYCFLEGDDIADFKSFCQLFNTIDSNRLARLVEKIKDVFEIILNSSAASSKN